MAAAKIPETKLSVTGIEGLDRIIGGGFPVGGVIHVSGGCGTGKTSLAMEFLVRGAAIGQKGMLVTTDRAPENTLNSVVRLDLFDEKFIKEKTLKMVDVEDILEKLSHPRRPIERNGAMEFLNELETLVDKNQTRRLAIDPVTPLLMDMEPGAARDFLKQIGESMHKKICTTILTVNSDDPMIKGHLACDGLIQLSNIERNGDTLRILQVQKMAGSTHSKSKYVFDLTPVGMLMTPMLRGGR